MAAQGPGKTGGGEIRHGSRIALAYTVVVAVSVLALLLIVVNPLISKREDVAVAFPDVTPYELVREYADDEIAANGAYQYKVIRIEGNVIGAEDVTYPGGKQYRVVEIGDVNHPDGQYVAQCFFNSSDDGWGDASLPVGAVVQIEGTFLGFGPNPMLGGCEVAGVR